MKLIVRIRGDIKRNNEGALEAALGDLRTGGANIRRHYFGVKDYDRFRGQRSDHPYGWVPRHGHIVFAVELTPQAQKQTEPFTAEQLADAIGYLERARRTGDV